MSLGEIKFALGTVGFWLCILSYICTNAIVEDDWGWALVTFVLVCVLGMIFNDMMKKLTEIRKNKFNQGEDR